MDIRGKSRCDRICDRIKSICEHTDGYIRQNILQRLYQGLFHRVLKLSIARKLLLGYLPLSILLIAISFFSLSRLDNLNTINTTGLYTHIPIMNITEDMSDMLLDQELYAGRYAIMQSPEMLPLFWAKSQEFKGLVKKLISITANADETAPNEILAMHSQYNSLHTELFDHINKTASKKTLSTADNNKTATLKDRIEAVQAAITIHIENIHSTALTAQSNGTLAAAEIGKRAFRVVSFLCILGIIIGIGTAAIISRTIFMSIKRLKKATRRVSEGEFKEMAIPLSLEESDELGKLSYAFNDMVGQLRELDEMHLDMSPLTRLPGGVAIENILKKRIDEKSPVSLCMADLDNFKAFNDRYGYAKGNEMIIATAELIKLAVKNNGGSDDFVGHIGGDDFIVITTPKSHSRICAEITRRFDELAPGFYSEEDRKLGYIPGKTRQGQDIRFPLASISIAVVTNTHHRFSCHIEMGEEVAELKEYAKSIEGSNFVVDKRRDDYNSDKNLNEDRSLH